MTLEEIRQNFLDFFSNKNHHILPTVPLIIRKDPTLMFVNSGMNPLKDYFTGKKKIIFTCKVSTQKCLRISGKHNDLEDVGKDSYHHTMFEMLGNWFFGFSIKKKTIEWAWKLITLIYKIPIDNIYATVFTGETKEGVSMDEESQFYWGNFLNKEHILYCKKKHNFWEMSNIGPCGPSSEIHIDLRYNKEKKYIYGKYIVNKDHPQLIELWNIVFIEYFRQFDGNLKKLFVCNIDTGLGFERLCRILQYKDSNYDTDIFSTLIRKVESISHIIYSRNINIDISMRIVVDHIRAITYAMTDSQALSNTGAGYVIRKLLRRALSYGYRFLVKKAFLYKLVKLLITEINKHSPEFFFKKKWIEENILYEENYFLKTMKKGMKRLKKIIQYTKTKKQNFISGITIFELYDTFGFPIDLSRLLIINNTLNIDEVGLKKIFYIKKAKNRLFHKVKENTHIYFMKKNEYFHKVNMSKFIQMFKYKNIKKCILYTLID